MVVKLSKVSKGGYKLFPTIILYLLVVDYQYFSLFNRMNEVWYVLINLFIINKLINTYHTK